MLLKLYPYRFELFFVSQMTILFGSLIAPTSLFENILSPLFFIVNLIAGILLISKQKKLMWFLIVLLLITAVLFGADIEKKEIKSPYNFMRMATYFLFYVVVTFEIIKQVWRASFISKNVILGLISGYISLGLIGFFICLSIELADPNSFQMVQSSFSGTEPLTESLMYFSYITLLTIGYGDILPLSALAHKAAILIGLMGQFYLVVITAIVVGKYINQLSNKT